MQVTPGLRQGIGPQAQVGAWFAEGIGGAVGQADGDDEGYEEEQERPDAGTDEFGKRDGRQPLRHHGREGNEAGWCLCARQAIEARTEERYLQAEGEGEEDGAAGCEAVAPAETAPDVGQVAQGFVAFGVAAAQGVSGRERLLYLRVFAHGDDSLALAREEVGKKLSFAKGCAAHGREPFAAEEGFAAQRKVGVVGSEIPTAMGA